MMRLVSLLFFCLLLTSCGGGGGGGGSSGGGGGSTPPPASSNFVQVTVDAGPAELQNGPDGYIAGNAPFVSVTLCAPGTSTCQTIDHVLVDTGSVGLRIIRSVLQPALLDALPNQTDPNANPVGECYGYVDGYVFGSVRQADLTIGGETVTNIPMQVVADTGPFATVPPSCSAGGGTNENTVQSFGANGIIGVSVTTTDCGAACERAGGAGAAAYYSCPPSGCQDGFIARSASTSAPFQQLPNPVAAMAVDNNGTILQLPDVPATGAVSTTGTLYFGIGTKSNNRLGNADVIKTTSSSSSSGPGIFTAVYKGQNLDLSFIDSGSNLYVFSDSSIQACTDSDFAGFYCPPSPVTLATTLRGVDGGSKSVSLRLNNARQVAQNGYSVLPGLGGDPDAFDDFMSYPDSFDFGLPFFYGRKVYTAIEGRSADGKTGPFYAF